MQRRHRHRLSRLHLPPVPVQFWQQLLIWSSVLVGSSAWALPIGSSPKTHQPPPTTAGAAPLPARAVIVPGAVPASGSKLPAPELLPSEGAVPEFVPQSVPQSVPQVAQEIPLPATPPGAESCATDWSQLGQRKICPGGETAAIAPLAVARPPVHLSDWDLTAQSQRAAALAPLPVGLSAIAPPMLTWAQTEMAATSELVAAAALANPAIVSATPETQTSPSVPVLDQSADVPTSESDPELGILRLREVPGSGTTADTPTIDPTTLQLNCDPELGCLRLKESPGAPASPASPRPKSVYLLGRFDYFRTTNVYSNLMALSDGLSRPNLSLYLSPALGPNTFFIGSIDYSWVRYSEQAIINYDEWRFRAGITQRLSPVMFATLGWDNQQLYIRSNDIFGLPRGTRFLNDHGVRLELSRRDQLAKKLSLNSFYQLRVGFAEPLNLSRFTNTFFVSLNYDLLPNLQLGLDYQVLLVHFTQQKRDDSFHQVLARLSYTLVRNVQLNVFGGYSFGSSSDPMVNFDGSVVGASLSFSLGLF